MNLEELIGFAELRQQMRNVGYDLRIANANFVGVVSSHQVLKQLLQRMRFRNHFEPPELRAEHGVSATCVCRYLTFDVKRK